MTKQQYMMELYEQLKNIPENERNNTIEYYNKYFKKAGIEDYMEIPSSVGMPEEVAKTVCGYSVLDNVHINESKGNDTEPSGNYNDGSKENDLIKVILLIAALVIFSPIVLSGLGAVLAIVIPALIIVVVLLVLSIVIGEALIVVAFSSSAIAGGIILLGAGLVLISIGIGCCILLSILFCDGIPFVIEKIKELFPNKAKERIDY